MKPIRYLKSLILQIRKDKTAYIIYLILNLLVAVVLVRTLIQRNFESTFICILAFFLFLIPPFVETTFRVRLPNAMEIIAFFFVFAAEILGDVPLAALAKQRMTPRRKLKALEIVLLVIGSPIWISLLLSALAVVLALYASWWSVLISLWASFASFAGVALGGAAVGPALCLWQGEGYGLLVIAGALASAGLAIFSFFGCREATRGTVKLTKRMMLGLKKAFLKKEDAQ